LFSGNFHNTLSSRALTRDPEYLILKTFLDSGFRRNDTKKLL
jgi:hypothetical protein